MEGDNATDNISGLLFHCTLCGCIDVCTKHDSRTSTELWIKISNISVYKIEHLF